MYEFSHLAKPVFDFFYLMYNSTMYSVHAATMNALLR